MHLVRTGLSRPPVILISDRSNAVLLIGFFMLLVFGVSFYESRLYSLRFRWLRCLEICVFIILSISNFGL